MRIEYLYRYPVKGLTAEALDAAEVEAGGCIPGTAPLPWRRAMPGSMPRSRSGCRRRTLCAR